MQKLLKYFTKTYLLLTLGVAVSITACKKDEESTPALLAAPTITVTEDTKVYLPGETAKIMVAVVAPGKLKTVTIGGKAITTFNNETNATGIEADYVIPAGTAEGDHEVSIIAVDKQSPAQTTTVKTKLKVGAPQGCTDFLTDCKAEGKTWVLKQGAGALVVGNNATGEVWWTSPAEAVTDRPCMFNDEWIFKTDGTVTRDMKDDFFVDMESPGPDQPPIAWPEGIAAEGGCKPMTDIPTQFQKWGNGNFTYTHANNELKMTGEGAFIGLYKVGETEAATKIPNAALTYKVDAITSDSLVIRKINGDVNWKFVLVPKP